MANDDDLLAWRLADRAGRLLVNLREESAAAGREPSETGKIGDRRSNQLLIEALAAERPGDAVLSEEAADDPARLTADRVWIVDPLDGTREYTMAGRTDWAVHVALWERGREVTSAAVALPALDLVLGTADPPTLAATETGSGPWRVVVSDSRPPRWIADLARRFPMEVTPMGSAGAKAMAVVRGDADAYVHAGGQYEWDSAAPVGVAVAAGLQASRLDGGPLEYNQANPYLPELLVCRQEVAPQLLAALADVVAGDRG
jgi:3'(2'), 5'-bisphosphate nucleotidase